MKSTEDTISEDSIFMVGKVVSVDGRAVTIKVEKTKNTSNLLYKGELLKNISVGGYVKIIKGFTKIIGKVEGEFISEDKRFYKKEYGSGKEKIHRLLNVSLLGFFKDDSFERGIKELPLIDNECFLLQNEEFSQVHNFLRAGDEGITIGTLSLEKGQKISLGINSLFASHIGVFGNTGSGKSYTLAKIYRELLLKFKDEDKFKENAEFFLLDFNGEYIGKDIIIEDEFKNKYVLSTREEDGKDKYPISEETINEATFWSIFLTATEKTQTPFLDRTLRSTYFSDKFDNEENFKYIMKRTLVSLTSHNDRTLEKGIFINFLKEIKICLFNKVVNLESVISDYQSKLQWHSKSAKYYYIKDDGDKIYANDEEFFNEVIDDKIESLTVHTDDFTHLDKIRLKIVFQFFDEVIKGFSVTEHIAPLIKRLDKRIIDLDKVIKIETPNSDRSANFTIVSLKDVNLNMKKVLPLLMCRQLYDQKKNENDEKKYLNLIIDEAHNILSYTSERESESWKDYRLETFEEIIKEGRKFGVFLTIASQRPSDISGTIISQLHNYFLHRLINNFDIDAIGKTISYLDKVSFEYLPILPTGTCIFAGIHAQVPVVIDIGSIEKENEPDNKTMPLICHWKQVD